jgi:hypothetical protein
MPINLLYHDVTPAGADEASGFAGPGAARYKLTPNEFTRHLGRYSVYRGMPATDAASLLSSPLRRWRQSAFWNLKKTAKTCAAPLYKTIRQRVLNRAYAATSAKLLRS